MEKRKIFLVLFVVLLPVFLILLSYKVNLFFYDLDENQENTIDFLKGYGELNLNYSEDEYSHLLDVKNVMKYLDYLFYLLLLVLSLIITNYKRDKEFIEKLFLYGGIVTASVVLVVLLFSLLFWNFTFTFFHQIFFPQGNWIFSHDSLLIQTFPIDFFISISMRIFLGTIFLGSLFILLKFLIKHATESKRA